MIDLRILSSLVKVFHDQEPQGIPLRKATALKGEIYSFQAAFCCQNRYILNTMNLSLKGKLAKYIRIRPVGDVVGLNLGEAAAPAGAEKPYVRRSPGLFPDVLYTDKSMLCAAQANWKAVWLTAELPENMKAGDYDLEISITEAEEFSKPARFTLQVKNAVLPPQTLKHTEWFYCDCICMAHNVKPWSKENWVLLEKYFRQFTAHGINMLLTPLFTPPLDTEIGGERLTTQLLGITLQKGKYKFDFSRFEKWVKLAKKCGVLYFEINHFFTQWGAAFCPKVVAAVNGKEKRIFGWDVKSDSPEYRDFLSQLLPALDAELKKLKIKEVTFFHVSDEPQKPEHREKYRKASEFLHQYLDGYRFIDAMSHPESYSEEMLSIPVPMENMLEKFMEFDLPERWTYYCCFPYLPYSNRMHPFPAAANRIIGVLLYLYQVDGFLHWGYNFWNRGRSGQLLHPLHTIEADILYPAGDGCLVYPGNDGPLDSVRGEIFYQGLQDMRALQKLESLLGRDKVIRLIEKTAGGKLSMNQFPMEEAFLLRLRDKINTGIENAETTGCKKPGK